MCRLKTPEEILEESGFSIEDLEQEETILLRNPDYSTAIVGVSDDNRVIYDYYKMLEYLVTYEEMDYESAADFVSYNTLRAISYMPGRTPIVMFPLFDD